MPGVAAVEDGERLRDVVVEEAGGGEGPGAVVEAIDDGGEDEDGGAGWGRWLVEGAAEKSGWNVPARECFPDQNYSLPFRGSG